MHIKKVLEYAYNYAQYLVTDGNVELKCVCMSVPLPDGREPTSGLKIEKIYAFSVDGVIIKKVIKVKDMKESIVKSSFNPLAYKFKGRVLDSSKAIIQIFGFKIELEHDYPNGLGDNLKNGDYVEFSVDRLDCVIEN